MTKAELVADLKNRIGPGVDVDDGGLTVWINDSYMQMADAIASDNPDFFTQDATAPTFAGQQQYDLPDDFERMVMVELQQDTVWYRLRPLPNINSFSNMQSTDTADGFSLANPIYAIYANQIIIRPIPTDSDGFIKSWYVYTPPALALDADVPLLPVKYHYLIPYNAYATFLDQDDEHTAAEVVRQRVDRRIASMVESLSDQHLDEGKSVIVTNGGELYIDDYST